MGFYQLLARNDSSGLQSPGVYFASVSTWGVDGLRVTTFFIMGFGYVTAVSSLKTPL